ncbi:FAD-dependent oxidoreductase [Paracoccus cavernae]|uniref:FAD-dependent oxidoreductase n=1 Tax=Paracoccus cavernae TaxID=1571207 RepID=A0ABT8D9Y1_9RHOB|nr:FAD-dependent oxidoreductase [Paracoccus cavernae]
MRAEAVVLATGSAPVELPPLPFGGRVISSTEALTLTEVPKTLAVVGGGYIGLELGTAFAKLGSEVTVLEAGPRILPQYDAELTRPVAQRLLALGIKVMTARARAVCRIRARCASPSPMPPSRSRPRRSWSPSGGVPCRARRGSRRCNWR